MEMIQMIFLITILAPLLLVIDLFHGHISLFSVIAVFWIWIVSITAIKAIQLLLRRSKK